MVNKNRDENIGLFYFSPLVSNIFNNAYKLYYTPKHVFFHSSKHCSLQDSFDRLLKTYHSTVLTKHRNANQKAGCHG